MANGGIRVLVMLRTTSISFLVKDKIFVGVSILMSKKAL